jgi:hypothetical protein
VTYLEELRDVIRRVHGVESEHLDRVPVKEVCNAGWSGMGLLRFLSLKGHDLVHRVYTSAHDTDDSEHPRRHVTVLHFNPIKSAQDAVRAV